MQNESVTDSAGAREAEPPPRYWAFISYSHRDRRWAEWLHRRLETYRVPREIVGGRIPRVAAPVFRDRDELSSASDLTDKVTAALRESRSLVVVCSPNAVQSRWVNEEISQFQKLGRSDRIFAFIIDGVPDARSSGSPETLECFPPALRQRLQADGSSRIVEPIAADAREIGDGKKHALLKLLAGILDVEFDKLRRRDQERQLRRRTIWAGVLLVLTAVFAGLTFYANSQRLIAIERQKVAVSRQLATEALNQMETRLDRSLLLAIEAHRISPTADARSAMLRLLQSSPGIIRFLHGHAGPVTALAVSPDGKTIASGGSDDTVRLWSIDGRSLGDGPIYRHAPESSGSHEVRAIAFSPDGNLIASGSLEGKLKFADVTTRKLRFVESNLGGTINTMVFNRENTQLYVGALSLHLLDPEADKLVDPPFAPGPDVNTFPRAAALSPDGRLLAVHGDGGLFLYDTITHKPVAGPLNGASENSRVLTFNNDGSLLASGAGGAVRVWKVQTRELIHDPISGDGEVVAMAFSSDSGRLSIIHSNGVLRNWSVANWTQVGTPSTFGEIASAAFTPDLQRVVLGDMDGRIRICDVDATRNPVGEGVSTGDWLDDVAFSPDGKTMAIGGDSLALWDVATRKEIRSFQAQKVSSVAFSGNGRIIAAAGEYGVSFWDVATGAMTRVPSAETEPYNWRIALTPDGRLAAFTGHSLSVWDIGAQKLLALPAVGKGSVYGVAISNDGALLAASSEDKSIYFLELPSGKSVGPPIAFGESAWSLKFAADDRALVVGGDSGKLQIFETTSHRMIGNLPSHPSRITDIAFSPDGKLMATSGMSRSLILYDWTNRQQLAGPLFPVSEYEVISGLDFSPDGRILAASERRQILWLLDGGMDAWILRGCRIANRNLAEEEWARYLPDEPYHSTCK